VFFAVILPNIIPQFPDAKGFGSMAISSYRRKRFIKDPALTAQEVVDNEFEASADQAESDLIVLLQQLERTGAVWAV
jgi:hypothetical protein